MKSIRSYLVFWVILTIAGTTIVLGFAFDVVFERMLVEDFDHDQLDRALTLGSLIEEDQDGIAFDFDLDSLPERTQGKHPEYVEVWLSDGTELFRSKSLGSSHLQFPTITEEGHAHWDLTLVNGSQGRAVALLIGIAPTLDEKENVEPVGSEEAISPIISKTLGDSQASGKQCVIALAQDRQILDRHLRNFRIVLTIANLILIALTTFVVIRIINIGLLPLNILSDRARAIDAKTLMVRMPTESQPIEVRVLSQQLNNLLERLEQSFVRERRMTANVAHELRTPIAELLATSEVAERWPQDEEASAELIAATTDVAQRMSRIVNGLLHLSRVEFGEMQVGKTSVDVVSMVDEAFRSHASHMASGKITLELRGTGPATLTDPHLIPILVSNLVHNAVIYCSTPGRIQSYLLSTDKTFHWRLSNPDSTLSEEDLERLTEPLWCKDPSRRNTQNSGLGLAIVADIVETLRGSLAFSIDDGRFQVEIRIGETDSPK